MKKIVHLCMCGPVTDGFSYQDNLLAKYHKKAGYEVCIIASDWIWDKDGKLVRDSRGTYLNEHGIRVVRLPVKHGKGIEYKFKKYKNLYETIEKEKPDILFIHGCQFLDIWKVKKYLHSHPQVTAYVDNHADFSNSGTNWISKHILHKILWKAGAKAIAPYVTKFYGVLPARVDFLLDMYALAKEKTELLVMGADDERLQEAGKAQVRQEIRRKYGYNEDDFVLITGGKIDYAKRQTLLLMEAIAQIDNPQLKLLIFGSVEEEIKEQFDALCSKDARIRYIGWLNADDTYDYFAAAELAVFPGRHSVMWEQVAGQGIPMICKYWEGTTHVDVGGNVKFIMEDTVEAVKKAVCDAVVQYDEMRAAAKGIGTKMFRYSEIAKRAIGEE